MSSRRCATRSSECSEGSPSSGGARARSSCERRSASPRSESSARRFQGFNALRSRRRSRCCRPPPVPIGGVPPVVVRACGVSPVGLGPVRDMRRPSGHSLHSAFMGAAFTSPDSVNHGLQPTPDDPRGPVTCGLLRSPEQARGPPSPALTPHPPSPALTRPHPPPPLTRCAP